MPRLLLAVALVLAACRTQAPPPPKEFNGPTAFGYIQTQMAFGNRIPGTPGHERMADWLDSVLRRRADSLVVQRWSHTTSTGDTLALRNFLARFKPGASERVLFLAHWDTRPHADGPRSSNPKAPVPGASDGASGVAVLLGVADVLKRSPPGVGVDLLFVDGEDYGDFSKQPNDVLIGSRYYAAHLPPGPRPQYAVLFDMVGDKDLQIYQEANSLTGAPDVVERVWSLAQRLGYQRYFRPDSAGRTNLIDDHVELQKAGIKAIDVVDFDYPPWHTPDDTIDKVSGASLQVVGDVALGLVRTETSKTR